MTLRIAAALMLALAAVPPAHATRFCVATANDLTAALAAANADTTTSHEVRIHTGTYAAPNGGWRVDAHNRGIVIEGGYVDATCDTGGADAALTVLDGHQAVRPLTIDTSFIGVQTPTGIVLRGLSFVNGAGDSVGGLKVSDSGPIYNGPVLIERNIFRNNVATTGVTDNSAGALVAASDGNTFDGAVTITVRDNLFVGNRAPEAAAAMMFSNNGIAVVNNTATRNQSFDTTLPTRTTFRTFSFFRTAYANNVFWGNNPDTLAGTFDINASNSFGATLGADLDNNDIQAITGTAHGTHNALAVDPGFVDAAHDDLRLAANSPLVNAGRDDATGGVGAHDVAGAARVQGAHVDIGALESDVVFRNGFE